MNLLLNTLVIIGSLLFLSLLYCFWITLREKEFYALRRILLLCLLVPVPFFLGAVLAAYQQTAFGNSLLLITTLLITYLFWPFGRKLKPENDQPLTQIDERDTMFSRCELKQGSPRYKAYYAQQPEKLELDEKFRQRPGLLATKSNLYSPLTFASASANFFTVEQFNNAIKGSVNSRQIPIESADLTHYLKHWAQKIGALDCGITPLQSHHLYSVKGRGETYGKTISNKHSLAIAFTVEMDFEMMRYAPQGPAIMESGQRYLQSGTIAIQVAAFLRTLGYQAQAHIDGNYEVVCPLVARDAGLGEIGRMGLLMTPKQGPRVRISVVTTNAPLHPDKRKKDESMVAFCQICKKCARVCPSQSIPYTDRNNLNGALRWQINSESCFTYWCQSGTDCGRCMSTCPYAHPDNLMHNAVRLGIRYFPHFRPVAAWMDDWIYGHKPTIQPVPKWMDYKEK